MKKQFQIIILIGIICLYWISCSKTEETKPDPVITLKSGANYVSTDKTFKAGEKYLVGVSIQSNGSDNLTNFFIKSDETTVVNEPMNTDKFDKDFTLIKNTKKLEILTFTVMDKDRKTATVTLNIKLDTLSTSAGKIKFISSIKLGAQNNSSFGSFYSIGQNKVFLKSDAVNQQNQIDIVFFYGKNLRTLSSPGMDSEGEILGVNTWTTKRTTYFVSSVVTIEQFDKLTNDSLLLTASKFGVDDWKRKSKTATDGNIMFIKTEEGKFGLLKVISASGDVSGQIEFALKIQE
jgi:hypothetical protein